MRFIGSFLGAIVVVSILLAIGVRLFGMFEPAPAGRVFHEVDLLSEGQKQDLAGVLGYETGPEFLPALADIPALGFRRSVQGFVQLELALDAAGRVTAAEVLGSTLPPTYQHRAIEMVRKKRYSPQTGNAGALGGRRIEIIEFRGDAPIGAE